MYWPLQFSTDSSINCCNLSYCLFLVNLAWLLSNLDKFTFKVVSFGTFPLINLKPSCKKLPSLRSYIISFPILIKLIHNPLMVPLKCNVALARMYFPRISILDTLLLTGTRTNSTRVEQRVKADVKDSIG